MAYLVNKQNGMYWKGVGEGLTPDIEKAHVYTIFQAQALARLHWEDASYLGDTMGNPGVMIEHAHTPDPRLSPRRTQKMKDNGFVWVSYEGVWLAASIQDLQMTTMIVGKDSALPPPSPRAA